MNKTLRKWLSVVVLLCLGGLAMRLSLGAARTHGISIRQMQFSPATLTISAGDTVTWTNRDDRDHQIAAADGSFKSPNLSTGATWSYPFARPGKVEYGCTYHPREKGTIIVGE